MIVVLTGFDRVFISGPGASGHAPHDIPGDGLFDDGIDPFAAVQHQTKSAVDGIADADAPAVMQCHQAHAPGRITGKALGGHIGHDIAAVFYVGSLSKGRIRAAGVVMIPAQHDGADIAVANHCVKFECDGHSSQSVLVKNSGLGSHHEFVAGGIFDPDIVVTVLKSPVRIDTFHGNPVGFQQIIFFAAQAYPAKRTVPVIKQQGTHQVLHIGLEYKAVQGVFAVFAYIADAGVVDGF